MLVEYCLNEPVPKVFEEMQPWLFYNEQYIQNKQSLKEQIMTQLQMQVIYTLI